MSQHHLLDGPLMSRGFATDFHRSGFESFQQSVLLLRLPILWQLTHCSKMKLSQDETAPDSEKNWKSLPYAAGEMSGFLNAAQKHIEPQESARITSH